MVGLHAFVDDGDEHVGAATRANPRAFHAEPVEGSAKAARFGRRHRHGYPLCERVGARSLLSAMTRKAVTPGSKRNQYLRNSKSSASSLEDCLRTRSE